MELTLSTDMTYEAELTIPVEQYGNIRPKVTGTAEEIVAAYREFSEALRPKPVNEMPSKHFNEIYDEYRTTGKIVNGGDFWEELSPRQKDAINELKKSFARAR